MDDRRYFDPRHRPPPSVSPSLGPAPSPTLHHRDIRPSAVSHSHSPENARYRDHPAFHQAPVAVSASTSSRRAWDDDRRPPPLPMIGPGSGSREMSVGHHLPAGSTSSSSFAPPRPSYYDYEQRRPQIHDESRLREYEGRLGHSFRGDFEEEDRFQDSRNVSRHIPSTLLTRLMIEVFVSVASTSTTLISQRILQSRGRSRNISAAYSLN